LMPTAGRNLPPPAWTAYDYSYIYYGEGNREFSMDSLYAHGPWASSVADIDGDGWLDIVFACSADDYSLIYYGSESGFKKTDSLSVKRASCAYLTDFDRGGNCDVALGSQGLSSMYLFYNRDEGWEKLSLPAKGVDAGITKDLGNPATHKDEAWYIPPDIIAVTESMDSLAVLEGYSMLINTTWQGEGSPQGADVELWVSATPNPEGGNWSDWIKLDPQAPYSISGRAFRYKLCFKTGMRTSLIVKKIELSFRQGGNPLIIPQIGREFDIYLDQSLMDESSLLPTIYDRLGRRVCVLQPDPLGHIYWLGEDDNGYPLPAGVYFLLVRQGNQSSSHKLVLLTE
ncbi:MAG: hypothetical protein U9Q76_03815, partial [candidate division WOR-3 bacterium]|nr:hypothetical protein [candidate division WOR-3 bacterium]